MGLDFVLPLLAGMPPTDDPTWPFEAAHRGEQLAEILGGGVLLRRVAESLIEIARREKCEVIAGVSPIGERMAAAAVALAGNGLRTAPQHGSINSVLLVEGLLVTGAQLVRGVRDMQSRGARRVCTVAVASLASIDQQGAAGIDNVELLSA